MHAPSAHSTKPHRTPRDTYEKGGFRAHHPYPTLSPQHDKGLVLLHPLSRPGNVRASPPPIDGGSGKAAIPLGGPEAGVTRGVADEAPVEARVRTCRIVELCGCERERERGVLGDGG